MSDFPRYENGRVVSANEACERVRLERTMASLETDLALLEEQLELARDAAAEKAWQVRKRDMWRKIHGR